MKPVNNAPENHWVKNDAGIYVPPDEKKQDVQKAEFAVKIIGFVSRDVADEK